ncbi:lipase chaperone family protein [Alteromonas flava]|uniref:lipase chaperone family protein n=1 Tax=Alteromonas flava TaxID=2048003 RepID=UPI000C287CCE|nr:lipase chaperone family protein [Alteromonas flava]
MRFRLIVSAASLVLVALVIVKVRTPETVAINSLTVANERVTPPHKTDVAVLPGLQVTEGQPFKLSSELKDVYDGLLLNANATTKIILLDHAKQYCDRQNLTIAACSEFLALFSRYIDYKAELFNVEQSSVNYSAVYTEVAQRLQQVVDLQYQHFSAHEVEVLFGQDNAIDAQALQRLQIAADPTLNREQKTGLIEQHFATLPSQQKQAFEPTLAVQSLQALESESGSNEHRLALVQAEFGDEVANRVATQWEQRGNFTQRVKSLYGAYSTIAENEQLKWLSQHFPENEAKRARVLLNAMTVNQ